MKRLRDIKNILVIKLRHYGDVLLTIPTFKALRRHFPQARLTAVVNAGTDSMLAGHPAVDEILVYNRKTQKGAFWQRWQEEWRFLRALRRQRFEIAIDLTGNDRAAFIALASGARYRLSSNLCYGGWRGKRQLYTHLTEFPPGLHVIRENLAIVEPLGIRATDLTLDRPIPAAAWHRLRRRLREQGWQPGEPLVHLHPTSEWLFKCWRDEAVAAIISWLLDQGLKVAITAAPAAKELARVEQILSFLDDRHRRNPRLLNLAGQTDTMELAAISAHARLFLGVDSMPMHLAAAVGTPVLALFGPSRLWTWAPWTPELANLVGPQDYFQFWQDGVYHLGPHLVIQRRWDCVPCNRDGCQGSKISRCLEEITPAEVQQAVTVMLRRQGIL